MTGSKRGARLRATAASVVDDVVRAGRSLDAALAEREQGIAADDLSLLRLLSYGTLRHHWRLMSWIDAMLDRPLKRRDSVITQLLAIGLYQLAETRIPDHAVVSQTVEAARTLRRPKLAPLVNAILRRARRDRIFDAEPSDERAVHDHPAWLLDRLREDWPDDWRDVVAANNARAPMWLRVSPSAGTAEDMRERLGKEGIASELLEGAAQALRLAEPQPVDTLPGFAAGALSVQDAAAQLAAPWLLAGGARRVLDACAAPGGKTGHLLELGGDQVDVTAVDRDPERLAAVADNLERLGLDATLIAADASNTEEWWDRQPFDAILLDAPCSATGVIRRHPDIKHLRRAADIDELAQLQAGLLDALWPTLAPGGRLLYVTCSVLRQENDEVVSGFLARTPDAREDNVLHDYNIRDLMRDKACGQQILPGTAEMDGFFYAGLTKVS
ncbi:MAG: 16S rRNA (cytosine(967)-C(5))-methyltransferase RsmB [Woeseiaceae bacterium]|nr:16S rRNA (cytosine(967)-C(5))-methyltransferase RsmB [Woeseiaceae bacterium]